VLAMADLVVEDSAAGLVVRTRDGRWSFDVIAFLEQSLATSMGDSFDLAPAWAHVPRITVDGLVLSRERWRFSPAALPFARLESSFDRFVGARRWAREHGLVRFCFVKIPEEPKPVYLDLASPTYVEIFSKLVRKASAISVSEMLPAGDESWLTDAHGKRYTSELRVTAVDPEPWVSEASSP
jgi:hypothetical protein